MRALASTANVNLNRTNNTTIGAATRFTFVCVQQSVCKRHSDGVCVVRYRFALIRFFFFFLVFFNEILRIV